MCMLDVNFCTPKLNTSCMFHADRVAIAFVELEGDSNVKGQFATFHIYTLML